MIKKAPVSFAIALLSALFLLYKLYFVLRHMRPFPWIYVLVCAAPLLLFGGVFVLRACGRLEKQGALAANITIAVILIAAIICNNILILLYSLKDGWDTIEGTTDAGQYKEMLWAWGYPSKSMCHFPCRIPKDAKNISFREHPQFLQGGSRFLLMYETTAEDMQSYRKKYEPLAKAVLPAGEWKAYEGDYYVPSGVVMDDRELTEDFEVILLDGTPFENHGYSYGLAVNENTNEILFFREVW